MFEVSILILPMAVFVVFWIYANLDSFLLAFQKEDYVSGSKELMFTLDNFKTVYRELFKDKILLGYFKNTVLFFAVALFINLPVSILMSYFIYKKIRMYKFFRVVAYLPNIITSAALVVLYKYTFMAGGPYDAILAKFGKEFTDLFTGSSALTMLLIFNVMFGFGPNMVVLGGAMNGISQECLEAGEIDGCTWFKELTLLILPMIWPTISTIIILGFAGFMSSTGPILAMTANNPETFSLSYVLYSYATGIGYFGQNIYYASAVGLTMTAVAFPLVVLLRKLLNRIQED